MKKIIYMEIITYLVGQIALAVKSAVGKFHAMIQKKKIKKINNDLMTPLRWSLFT